MKLFQLALLSCVLILSVSACSTSAAGIPQSSKGDEFPSWLILRVRQYETDMPISNTSVTVTISTDLGRVRETAVTNETGVIQIFLGNVQKASSSGFSTLQEVELSNNYTLIRVQSNFLEDASSATQNYEAEYLPNLARYDGLLVSLPRRDSGTGLFIEGNLWVVEGKLVRVSDFNPDTGEKENLSAKPAIKTDVGNGVSEYESWYFFPLNYEVTIFHEVNSWTEYETQKISNGEELVPPLTVRIGENATLINWSSHAAETYVDRQTRHMDKDMEWLASCGYPADQERKEYQAIRSLLDRALQLYQNREYAPGLGGTKISEEKLSELSKWIQNLKILAVVTSVGISLFAYGFASLLSRLIFVEPSENERWLAGKLLMFSLVMLVFSLTHPSLKMTFALITGSRSTDVPLSLLGCFLVGGATYLLIGLISLKKRTMTDLSVQLGVRSLKRRRSRTLLTLITITTVVSSAIVFVNISMSRTTRINGSWEGTNISAVLVEPDTFLAPLSEYDINWTRSQAWCKDLGYREGIRLREKTPDADIRRTGFLKSGRDTYTVTIVGIDPVFLQKHYNLSEHIRGFWQEFSKGKAVAIIPTTFRTLLNENVTLGVREVLDTGGLVPTTRMRDFGEFRVIGTFDPETSFVDLKELDNTPLFEEVSGLVLVPIESVKDPAMTFLEVTSTLNEGFDPLNVAEELAYTLAAPTVANGNGLARRIEWSLELSVTGLIPYIPTLAIAGMMMYATMASVYEERRREYVTLATLGLDPKNTFQVFLVEALLLGLMGTFIGFLGSYVLETVLRYSTSFLLFHKSPEVTAAIMNWSMPAILVALFTGVVMVFFGAYVPASRTLDLSLMGRVKERKMIGELVSEGDVTSFSLPIRETIQNGELLYAYVRETLGKLPQSLIDNHSIKGELYGDGTFKVSFFAIGSAHAVSIPCEIKGARRGEILVPVIEFPAGFSSYKEIRRILRDLEKYMIGFSSWKEMQLKMSIVREAPRKRKTIEEILNEIKAVINEMKDCNKKLRILEGQKPKLSEEVYSEFRQKYINMIEEKSKNLRSMTINLEPYHKEFHEEIGEIEVDVERITTAYSLGEIDEEEYIKTCGPLQRRLTTLRDKVQELEEIFEFLKRPVELI